MVDYTRAAIDGMRKLFCLAIQTRSEDNKLIGGGLDVLRGSYHHGPKGKKQITKGYHVFL